MSGLIALLSRIPLKYWIGLGVGLLIIALWGAYEFQKARADRAVTEARQATVTSDALDKVATKTDQIRVETKEKEAQVDQIEGSDTRLPDGFGLQLECVRRGQRDCDS